MTPADRPAAGRRSLPPWPFAPAVFADPAPTYARWRECGPVVRDPDHDAWVVSGYRPLTAILRSEHTSVAPVMSAADLGAGHPELGTPVARTLERMAIFRNPPHHRPLRLALQPAFGVDGLRRVRQPLGERAAALVDDALGRTPGAAPTNLMTLCEQATTDVLDTLCGLPGGAGPELREVWRAVSASVDRPGTPIPAQTPALVLSLHEALFRVIAGAGAGERPIDIYARQVRALGLDPLDAAVNLLLVLTSGHRSLVQTMALALHTLVSDPRQQQLLRDDRSLVPAAIDELLRWDGSVQLTTRTATRDLDLGDVTIGEGELIVLLLGGAHRDPAHFDHADALDVTRPPRRHVAFGRGAHFCPGATLARMTMTEVITHLLHRTTRLELAAAPEWHETRRGVADLQVVAR